MVRDSLVDEKVCGFSEWKRGLEAEDLADIGRVARRTPRTLLDMYRVYRKFQTRSDVAKRRQELYGVCAHCGRHEPREGVGE